MSRHLTHPGPPVPCRRDQVNVGWQDEYLPLDHPTELLEIVRAVVQRGTCRSQHGSASVQEGRLEAFTYVVPAVPRDGSSIATWGEPRIAAGPADIEVGNMTLGVRAGEPFVHFHALWRDANGQLAAGHLLPDTVVLGAGTVLFLRLSPSISWAVAHDSEINLPVFHLTANPSLSPSDPGKVNV